MSIVNNLYYPAFLGECSKHKGYGCISCPLCAIEDVERRRKELSEMLNENDFDIDSFIDYQSKKNMKKVTIDGVTYTAENSGDFGLVPLETMYRFAEFCDQYATYSRSRGLWSPFDDFKYYTTSEFFIVFTKQNNKI